MRAAVRYRFGPPDVVEIRDIDRRTPKADEVLVRVQAASVNRADLDGLYPKPSFTRLFLGVRAPRNRRVGCDGAGIVEPVGPNVTRFRPNDRIFGDLYPHGLGSLAQYVCASELAFAAIPPGMTFEVAATLPHSAILAVQYVARCADDQDLVARPDRSAIAKSKPKVHSPSRLRGRSVRGHRCLQHR